MEFAYEQEYHGARMSAEMAKEQYYDALLQSHRIGNDTDRLVAAIDRLTRATEAVALATIWTDPGGNCGGAWPVHIKDEIIARLGLGAKDAP